MAGRIPEKFVDEVLARADIVDVIDRRVPLKQAGREYKACCPFHEEKTPSFTVSPDKQFYHCFGCGAHGSAIGFLMDYEHMSFPEAVEELARGLGLEVPHEGAVLDPAAAAETQQLLAVLDEADQYFRKQLRQHPQADTAVAYLKGRGLTGEIARDFGIGFAPDDWEGLCNALGKQGGGDEARMGLLARAGLVIQRDKRPGYFDRFRQRIMFPIHDHRGRVVGFGGRILGKGEPKYMNSPETPVFHKGREIYGLYRARDAIHRAQRALVVEGYMDVVALAQQGIDYAVATLGTAATREHLERLFRHTAEIVFCFDGDRAGREAGWRALEQCLPLMRDGRQVSFLFLPEGEDPDSLIRKEGRERFEGRLEKVTPLPDLLLQELSAQVDLGRVDGKARLVELARPLLSKLPPGVFRTLLGQMLAEKTGLEPESLLKSLSSGDKSPSSGARSQAESGSLLAGNRAQAGKDKALLRGREAVKETLLRALIRQLMLSPELAAEVDDLGYIPQVPWPGVPVLQALLEVLREKPDLTTGQLLDRFRDTEYGAALGHLVTQRSEVESVDKKVEFQDTLRRLRRKALDARLTALTTGKGSDKLTDAEKAELSEIKRARLDG